MNLVATYIIESYAPSKPEDQTKNISNEVISFVRNLRLNDLKRSSLILDLKNKKVVKCRAYKKDGTIYNDADYDQLFNYYYNTHTEQIDEVLRVIQ